MGAARNLPPTPTRLFCVSVPGHCTVLVGLDRVGQQIVLAHTSFMGWHVLLHWLPAGVYRHGQLLDRCLPAELGLGPCSGGHDTVGRGNFVAIGGRSHVCAVGNPLGTLAARFLCIADGRYSICLHQIRCRVAAQEQGCEFRVCVGVRVR